VFQVAEWAGSRDFTLPSTLNNLSFVDDDDDALLLE
jgi:hypothetical protein